MKNVHIPNIFDIIKPENVDDYFWKYYNVKPKNQDDRKQELHQDETKYITDICGFGEPYGKLLSVGCGYGINEIYMGYISENVEKIVGVDLEKKKIKSMNNIVNKIGNNSVYSIHGNGKKLPFKDEDFDYVMMIEVLSHACNGKSSSFNQKKLIRDVSRVLKPGGTLLAIDFNNAMNPIMLVRSKRLKNRGTIENPVNPYYLKSILKELNYSDFSTKPYTPCWEKRSGLEKCIDDFIRKTPFNILNTTGFMFKSKKL